MQDKPTGNVKDEGIKEHLRHIYENAWSNDVKTVDAEPTTDTLKPTGTPQLYSSDLYFNIQGTIYKVALTSV